MTDLSNLLPDALFDFVREHEEVRAFIAREWWDQWPDDVLIRGAQWQERDGKVGAYVEYDLRDVEPVAPYHAWVDLERVCDLKLLDFSD
jgi:hypothetical protein